jgi:hypothetical protein
MAFPFRLRTTATATRPGDNARQVPRSVQERLGVGEEGGQRRGDSQGRLVTPEERHGPIAESGHDREHFSGPANPGQFPGLHQDHQTTRLAWSEHRQGRRGRSTEMGQQRLRQSPMADQGQRGGVTVKGAQSQSPRVRHQTGGGLAMTGQ